MGRIFKTPKDDAVEETLRAMHIANTVDTTYERGMAWIKVVIFSTLTAFIVSGIESTTDWNLWESTVDWFRNWCAEQLEKIVG